jgi:hypothetical protein
VFRLQTADRLEELLQVISACNKELAAPLTDLIDQWIRRALLLSGHGLHSSQSISGVTI